MNESFVKYNILKYITLAFSIIFVLALSGVFIAIFTVDDPNVSGPWAFTLFGIAFVSQMFSTTIYLWTKHKFKQGLLDDFLNDSFEHGVYKPKRHSIKLQAGFFKRLFASKHKMNGLTITEIEASQFVPIGHVTSSYDYIEGEIEGVQFISSDVWSQSQTSSDRKSKLKTIFKGRVIIFDFNKPIKGHVLALEKFKPYAKSLEKIDTESIAFNKTFNTYTNDAALIFYILTPQMIEVLLDLEQNHPGKIGFSFIGRKLYVALNLGRDTLYLPKIKPIDTHYMATIKKDFKIFHPMINALKLSDDFYKIHSDEAVEADSAFEYEMAESFNPKTAASSIVSAMNFSPANADKKKTLVHNEESQRLYDFTTKTMNKSQKKQFDQTILGLSSVRLLRTTESGEYKAMPKLTGCLIVFASVFILILMAAIASCVF